MKGHWEKGGCHLAGAVALLHIDCWGEGCPGCGGGVLLVVDLAPAVPVGAEYEIGCL